jgi:hypothetical protein
MSGKEKNKRPASAAPQRTWQQVVFVVISIIVILSWVLTLILK